MSIALSMEIVVFFNYLSNLYIIYAAHVLQLKVTKKKNSIISNPHSFANLISEATVKLKDALLEINQKVRRI
jgi:hypothetical protein